MKAIASVIVCRTDDKGVKNETNHENMFVQRKNAAKN